MEAPNLRTTYVPAKALYLVEHRTVKQKAARQQNPFSRVEAINRLTTYVLAKASYLVDHGTVPQKPA